MGKKYVYFICRQLPGDKANGDKLERMFYYANLPLLGEKIVLLASDMSIVPLTYCILHVYSL